MKKNSINENNVLLLIFPMIIFFIGLTLGICYFEQKDRVYLDNSMETFHMKDTININGKKYLRVYDRESYGQRNMQSWLVEVK